MRHVFQGLLGLLFVLFSTTSYAQFNWTGTGYSGGQEFAKAIATDPMGNSYVVGEIDNSTTIVTTTSGPVTLTGNGDRDIYVAMYDPSGGLVWINSYGGTENEFAKSIAVNAAGIVTVIGITNSDALTFGTLTPLPNPILGDGFIVTFDAETGIPQWAESIEGPRNDNYIDVEMLDNGIIAVGKLESENVTIGTTTLTNNSTLNKKDILMTRYDLEGNVVWTQNHGGLDSEVGMGVTVNGDRVYMVGYYYSNTGGTLTLDGMTTGPCIGDADMFLTKFDAGDPNDFSWLAFGGGPESDYFYDITTDKVDGVYIHGSTASSYFFTPGIFPSSVPLGTGMNVHTLKYSETDGSVYWMRRGVGPGYDQGTSIKADGCGNIYTTGSFGLNINLDFGPTLTGSLTSGNPYLLRYDPNGNVIGAEAPVVTGSGGWGAGVAIGKQNNPVLTGTFRGSINLPGTGTHNSTAGSPDMFVTEYNVDIAPNWQHTSNSTLGEVSGVDVAVDASGDVYATGTFSGATTLGVFPDNWSLTGEGMYVAKYSACGRLLWAAESISTGIDARGITLDKTNGWVYVCGNLTNSAIKTFISGRTPAGEGCGVSMSGWGTSYLARYSMANGCLLDLKIFGDDHLSNSVSTDSIGNVFIAHEYSLAGEKKISAGKYDLSLNLVWEKSSVAPVGYDCIANDIIVYKTPLEPTAVYLTGAFRNQLSVGPHTITNLQIWDAWALKLTDVGSTASANWLKKGDANEYSNGQSITVDPNGTPYVTGTFQSQLGSAFSGDPVTGTVGERSAFVARLDATTGVSAWANPITAPNGVYGMGISGDNDGLFLTGYWHGDTTSGAIVFPASQGIAPINWNGSADPTKFNIYIARYSYDNTPGSNWGAISEGMNLHQAFGIAVNNSGYCYTTGGYRDAMALAPTYVAPTGLINSTFSMKDAFLVRTEKNLGDFLKTAPSAIEHDMSASSQTPKIFPNPSKGIFNVQFPNGINGQLEVFDIHGKVLKKQMTSDSQAQIDLTDLAQGIYILSWLNSKGEKGNSKLLKQ